MKLMMLVELGSTGADETSAFHRLLVPWKGTKPLRLVSWPTVIPAQVPACATAEPRSASSTARVMREIFTGRTLFPPVVEFNYMLIINVKFSYAIQQSIVLRSLFEK